MLGRSTELNLPADIHNRTPHTSGCLNGSGALYFMQEMQSGHLIVYNTCLLCVFCVAVLKKR